mgnify:CR=1 FL=1
MFVEWILLILSGVFLGAFTGVTTFILIFLTSIYIFNRVDSDITIFVTLIVIVFMLFAYYGFSLTNFFEKMREIYTKITPTNEFKVDKLEKYRKKANTLSHLIAICMKRDEKERISTGSQKIEKWRCCRNGKLNHQNRRIMLQ